MNEQAKNPIKVAGGIARAEALTAEQRKAIGKNAAQARWDKEKGVPRAD